MHNDLMEILRREKPPAGVMHGFSGGPGELAEWLDMGYYVTVGTAVLGAEGQGRKEVVRLIPEDRLLLESDSAKRSKDGLIEGQERVIKIARVVASWRGAPGRRSERLLPGT
jgi:Tat protein secretion system quality control protein TatD with DNase activity